MATLIWTALATINAWVPAASRGGLRLEWIVLARMVWPIAPRVSDAVLHASAAWTAPWLHLAATAVV